MSELYECRFRSPNTDMVYVCVECAAALDRSWDAAKHTAWHEALRQMAQVAQ